MSPSYAWYKLFKIWRLIFHNGKPTVAKVLTAAGQKSTEDRRMSGADPEIEGEGAHIELGVVRPCGACSARIFFFFARKAHSVLGGSGLASNPGFPFRILSRSFGEKIGFSPKLRDKIRNGKPGFEARSGHAPPGKF